MPKSFDAIVVLGGGMHRDGKLSTYTTDKLDFVVRLAHQHRHKAIIVSGGYSYKLSEPPPITEAEAMKRYLVARGISCNTVYKEEQSKDTLGNIYFTKVILLAPHSWSNILVVASINHSLERVTYVLQKVLGPKYHFELTAKKTNDDNLNKDRETKSLHLTKQLLHGVNDGDDGAVYQAMKQKHVAYSQHPEFSKDQLLRLLSD